MTDIEIAQSATMAPIQEIAGKAGIPLDALDLYGKFKAKLPLELIDEDRVRQCKLVLVTAISPTPAGEGKTTISIGLAQGLNRIGKNCTVVLREPSLGPVFGIKGGATGGGYSQVLPMEDINLHFTGDFPAVEKAHNLLSALVDNNLQNKKFNLQLDPRTITWKRVFDMNDRALRQMVIGLGGTANGIPRETGFDITAASEIMAILCLSNNRQHLKEKLGNIFIGFTQDKQAVYARDLKAQGAMAALLKEAIKPNLVQTMEQTPAIIHGGPFANIAQGTNTILATKMGMSCSDYVVTEAGFGSDLGAEKFLDIKCQYAGIAPQAVVIVATIRALRYHGGAELAKVSEPNPQAVSRGLENLYKHIENIQLFGIQPIVAVNHFVTDTPEEVNMVIQACQQVGVTAVESRVWAEGGKGGESLAHAVTEVIQKGQNSYRPLYDWNLPVTDKIFAIASKIYGAAEVDYTAKAKSDLARIKKLGLEGLPVCIAKTQKSLSDDQKRIGRPKDFTLTIREIELASGAGFIIPIAGEIMRMPGLPDVPAAENIDIDESGNISGLF